MKGTIVRLSEERMALTADDVHESDANFDQPVKTCPKIKVHQPEPERKAHAVVDDIEFDDTLLA